MLLSAPSEADLYDRWLVVESDASSDLLASVAVLETELQNMTGVDFNVTDTKTTGRGIFLLNAASDLTTRYPDLASQSSDLTTLATRDTEGFFIYSSGSDNLYIVGNTDHALDLGVFYYLQKLGWAQLMNGDNWRIVPDLDSITIAIDSVEEPDFRLRNITASGNFSNNIPLDMDDKLGTDYEFWQRATLQGGSIRAAGHTGEQFNDKYRDTLQDNYDTYIGTPNEDTNMMMAYNSNPNHPGWQWDWYKWPAGEDPNVPTSDDYIHVKMNPSSDAVRDLFVDDRVQAYKDLLALYGTEDSRTWAISVDPADGTSFDENPTTLANFPTVQDQVLYFAKAVADELLLDSDPDVQAGNVTLTAYGGHVMVPERTDILNWIGDANSNFYILVTPYAYTNQYTELSGTEIMEAWADVTADKHLGIYDYWNIPGWTSGETGEDFAENGERIQTWWDLGYDGFQGEAGVGAAVAPMMYMATQMLYDTSVDPTDSRNEFYDLAFGDAAVPMKRMLERWGGGTLFTYSAQEIGQSFEDLAEARTLAADDPGSLARVNDYVKYTQYLRKYFEYTDAVTHGATDAERRDLAEDAFQIMWQNHDAGLMNTWIIGKQLWKAELGNTETGTSGFTVTEDWDLDDPDAWGWDWVKNNPLTDADVTGFLTDGLADYGSSGSEHETFDRPVFSETLVALNSTALDTNVVQTPFFLGKGGRTIDFTFIVPTGETELDFQVQTSSYGPNAHQPVHIVVYDDTQTVVFDDYFGGDDHGGNLTWLDFKVKNLTAGDTYTMSVVDKKHGFSLEVPEKLPFALTGDLTSLYTSSPTAWDSYFYVPTGTETVGLFADLSGAAQRIEVRDDKGDVVTAAFGDGAGETDFTVASGHDGEVWSVSNLDIYHQPLKALNIPNVWSFSADGMLVPENLAPEVYAGGDQTIVVPTTQVTLDATMIDDGMSGLARATVAWTKISGPGTVTFGNAAAVDTTATFGATGTYVLRLTATDSDSLSAYDEVTIEYLYTAANTAPTVDAGDDDSVAINGAVATASLDGTVTDDGLPNPPAAVTYQWTKVEGPGTVYFADPTAVDTDATFDEVGTYRLRLTADDNKLDAYDEVTVTVLPDYTTPVYNLGDVGTFGLGEDYDYLGLIATMNSTDDQVSARFRALETVTVNRVLQRFVGIDAGTNIEVGIMADDGAGNPDGTFLVSSGSFDPADGTGEQWAVFNDSYELQYGEIYHVVTRATSLGAGDVFNVRRSTNDTGIRPYDRAADPTMKVLSSTNGGAWVEYDYDPFFTFGSGSPAIVVPGPGQAYAGNMHNSVQSLDTSGGTNTAMGQKFTIFTSEVAAENRVVMTGLTTDVYKAGNPTADLILRLHDADGVILATITVDAGDIATTSTQYIWQFDDDAEVWLTPGSTYYLTSEMSGASTTNQHYYFRAAYSSTDPTSLADNTWGGATDAVPIQSDASNKWNSYDWANPTIYTGKEHADLLFSFTGEVVAAPRFESGTGEFGLRENFTNTAGAMTLDSINDYFSTRFTAQETVAVDRVLQKLSGVDAGTRIEVGIMADNGNGNPDGRYLVSTGSYDPTDGDNDEWSVFTQSYELQMGEVYHIVTRMTLNGGSDAFLIKRSASASGIRPYDRAGDAQMTYLTSTDNGANWTDGNYDPYFVLANGPTPTIAQGPGQAYVNSASNRLSTRGGTGAAMGQKFMIFTTEAAPSTTVTVSEMTFTLFKTGSPTADLVIKLRDADGTVLGTITKTAASIATTSTEYTWSFDGSATVGLTPGQTYFITTEMDGSSTTSQYYRFKGKYSKADAKDATWGGTTEVVPIQSGASNDWSGYNWSSPTLYAARDDSDLWFSFDGTLPGGGSMMAMAQGGSSAGQQAALPLTVSSATQPVSYSQPGLSLSGSNQSQSRLTQLLRERTAVRTGSQFSLLDVDQESSPLAQLLNEQADSLQLNLIELDDEA